jgi:NADH dehydrogenase FAD-containing subunit
MGIFGALATAWIPGWPMTSSGLISFVAWNLVYLILLYQMMSRSFFETELY